MLLLGMLKVFTVSLENVILAVEIVKLFRGSKKKDRGDGRGHSKGAQDSLFGTKSHCCHEPLGHETGCGRMQSVLSKHVAVLFSVCCC